MLGRRSLMDSGVGLSSKALGVFDRAWVSKTCGVVVSHSGIARQGDPLDFCRYEDVESVGRVSAETRFESRTFYAPLVIISSAESSPVLKERLPYLVSRKASRCRESSGVVHRCVRRLLGSMRWDSRRLEMQSLEDEKRTFVEKSESAERTTIVLSPSVHAA